MSANSLLVQGNGLVKHYPAPGRRRVHAVDGVTLAVARGETLGLVGESGCGKSTLGRLLCRLEEPTRGDLSFDDIDMLALPPRELRRVRRRMQMVFQDSVAALNPHKTVRQILRLPLRLRGIRRREERRALIADLLQSVGLDLSQSDRFPHQLSGGQRQRIGIARALACQPDLLVADEPVASLDVSVQAQVLEVFRGLQQRLRLTTVFISHDISVVSHVSQRIAVMYLGKIVELGPAQEVIQAPQHPYTSALLAAVPRIGVAPRPSALLPGDPPSPMHVPPGCRFHTRCPLTQVPECREGVPELRETTRAHFAACHLA
jgi:oligopeptide/dipeptide ABC transporter ATP-binding protein